MRIPRIYRFDEIWMVGKHMFSVFACTVVVGASGMKMAFTRERAGC